MNTTTIRLGDYLASPGTELTGTPYTELPAWTLPNFLAAWDELHGQALNSLRMPRIHPTAYISDHAIIGDDVIIGPGARVHEFSTVRRGSVLGAGCWVLA